MKTNKKFLIPMTAALATIGGLSQATESKQAAINEERASDAAGAMKKALKAEDSLATYSRGGELHGLILRKNFEGITVAEHYSHRSHSSHSSHSSHYSSR